MNAITGNTQTADVYQLMQLRPEGITPLTALNEIGCMRLGARIHDLKKLGINIKSELIKTTTGKRVARYSLVK